MKHKRLLGLAFAGAITMTAAGYVGAQQPPQKGEMKGMGDTSMGGMMKECHEHHQAMTKSMDQMGKTLGDAQQSNDPAKMKAAIGQAQKQLASMKEHMSMCDNMMNMQNMPGGMMKGTSK